MPFSQLLRLNRAFKWWPKQTRTVVRFGPHGLDVDHQEMAARWAKTRRKMARNEAIADTILWVATFGLGIGVGWLVAQQLG